MKLRVLVIASAVAVSQVGAAGAARAWEPRKPVEIWVTFGKGAHADIWAKEIISIIEKKQLSNVKFSVVNIPKGAGVEAFPKFGKLNGDNHKLMLVLPNVFTVPLYKRAVKFNLMEMTPIARMGSETLAIWIKTKFKDIKTISALVEYARSKGSSFRIVGPPLGTPRAMLAQVMLALYGINGSYVGIRKIGSTARVLSEQDFEAAIYNPSEQLKLPDPGVVKPIAFLSHKRVKNFISVPTLPETGMAVTYQASRVVIGPRAMSNAARDYYTQLFEKVFNSNEWQARRKREGHIDGFLAGADLNQFLLRRVQMHERWKMAVDALLEN